MVAQTELCREGMQAIDLSNGRRADDGARFHSAQPMSRDAAEPPKLPRDDPGDPEPILSQPIQRHLGSLLAAVYARNQAELSAVDRFADLLARLDAALGDARERDDAAFQELLMTVIPALRRFGAR